MPDWAVLTAVSGILVAASGGFIVAVTQNWIYGGLILAGLLAFVVGALGTKRYRADWRPDHSAPRQQARLRFF